MGPTTHLQREIMKLKERVLALGAEVERALENAQRALTHLDPVIAQAVIDYDEVIDEHEVNIEEECLKILALYQPVAADLRFVIAVLKINNDLERTADLAANVCNYVKELHIEELISSGKFTLIVEETRSMVRRSLDALVNADPVLAISVCKQDDVVDNLNVEIIRAVTDEMKRRPDKIEELAYLISCSRSFERIADIATNIAEDVYYMALGEIIRHHIDEVEVKRP